MLIQFRFKNYKSFRDETILDLSATKITEHTMHVLNVGNEKLLPISALYGANASGKSNVIDAFSFMRKYVINSFAYGGDLEDKNTKIEYRPFAFDNSKEKESLFEVYFIDSEDHNFKSYNYGFTLNNGGVIEEWLNSKAKSARKYSPIFYRNKEEIDLSGLPKRSQENIRVALEKETLIVSLGAKLKIPKLKIVRDWFANTVVTKFGDPFENAMLSTIIPNNFAEDKSVQDKVVKYFSSFDSSIIGFDVKKFESENDGISHIKIDALHKTIDGGVTSIPLEEESDGTLKMFTLYPMLQDVLENGGVLFIDELNSRLHPLLVRNFLLTFLNKDLNKNHAQLIFTAHDSWQLSNNVLRRDEIWFTEKDSQGVSELYSLVDFIDESGEKIRKDANYERNYLLGKYGAIPKLRYFDVLNEEDSNE